MVAHHLHLKGTSSLFLIALAVGCSHPPWPAGLAEMEQGWQENGHSLAA